MTTVTKQDCYIWWTNQRDAESAQFADRTNWPEELEVELNSRMGRAGRGSLWVPSEWTADDLGVEWKDNDPMFNALGDHYGGIVFRREHLPLLATFAGFITDFDMNPIQGQWYNLSYEMQP